jgi:hypothetical protein
MTIPVSDLYVPFRKQDFQWNNLSSVQSVVDHDMAAVGVAAYTALNSADLTKQPNGSGGQVLRIGYNGVGQPGAQQNALTQDWHQVLFRVRSEGVTALTLTLGGTDVYHFPPSTEYNELYVDFLPAGTSIVMSTDATSGGQYAEVDIISAFPFETRSLDLSGNGNHAIWGDGKSPANYPTHVDDIGVQLGSPTYFRIPDPLPGSVTRFTMALWIKNAVQATNADFLNIGSAAGRFAMFQRLSTGQFRFYFGGASSANAAFITPPQDDAWHLLIGHHDSVDTKIWFDTAPGANAATPLPPNPLGQDIWGGRRYSAINYFNGIEAGLEIWYDIDWTQALVNEYFQKRRKEIARLTL